MFEVLYSLPDNDSITVVVTEGRWDVFDEPTPRKKLLTQILTNMGGVSDTVAPGTYHFNVKSVAGQWIASLKPAPQ